MPSGFTSTIEGSGTIIPAFSGAGHCNRFLCVILFYVIVLLCRRSLCTRFLCIGHGWAGAGPKPRAGNFVVYSRLFWCCFRCGVLRLTVMFYSVVIFFSFILCRGLVRGNNKGSRVPCVLCMLTSCVLFYLFFFSFVFLFALLFLNCCCYYYVVVVFGVGVGDLDLDLVFVLNYCCFWGTRVRTGWTARSKSGKKLQKRFASSSATSHSVSTGTRPRTSPRTSFSGVCAKRRTWST